MSRSIAIVEDEPAIRENYAAVLRRQGYQVATYKNRPEAMQGFEQALPDLAIIDIGLEDEIDGGFALCQSLRSLSATLPIIFLTARDSDLDTVSGLRMGADDYLTKPFELEELLLRIGNLIRRNTTSALPEEVFSFGDNKVYFKSFEVVGRSGERVRINKREMEFLRYLILNQGQVVRREDILEQVWGYDVFPNTRTIDNYVLALRKHFEENPRQPRYIHSVRGVGYKFTP